MTTPVRVLIVEDHPIFRDGLRTGLASLPDVVVVAEAATADQALTCLTEHDPHVVLMDLNLPGTSGIEATRQITALNRGIAVLVLTMHDDDTSVFAAVRAGASGYLLKGADREELRRAISSVAAGEAVFGPGVARRLLAHFDTAPTRDHDSSDAHLTEREREILDLIAEGWGNQAVARRLHITAKTVRNNVSTIITKLHAADRGEAIVRARTLGYGAGPAPRPRTDRP